MPVARCYLLSWQREQGIPTSCSLRVLPPACGYEKPPSCWYRPATSHRCHLLSEPSTTSTGLCACFSSCSKPVQTLPCCELALHPSLSSATEAENTLCSISTMGIFRGIPLRTDCGFSFTTALQTEAKWPTSMLATSFCTQSIAVPPQTISYLHVHKDVQNLCSIQLFVSYSYSLPPIHMLAQREGDISALCLSMSAGCYTSSCPSLDVCKQHRV